MPESLQAIEFCFLFYSKAEAIQAVSWLMRRLFKSRLKEIYVNPKNIIKITYEK